MGRGRAFIAVLLAAAAACVAPWQLPDRSDAWVRAEEARLATTIEDSGAVLGTPGGSCDARLLNTDPENWFLWVECESRSAGAASMPVVVRGDDVLQPEDGAGYADSVRELFPRELAHAILTDPDRLRP